MTAARSPRAPGGVLDVICDLRDRIASMEGAAAKRAGTLAFGVPEIDAALHGGGLAYGALHEFAGGGSGTVDGAAAALFVAGIAARTKGPVIWCLTRPDLFFRRLQGSVSIPTASFSWSPTGKRTFWPIWRRGSRLAVSGRSSANLSACRWSVPDACSWLPSEPGRWRLVSAGGDGRRRRMILASRRRQPPDGG